MEMEFTSHSPTNHHDCLITGMISENELPSVKVIIEAGNAFEEMPGNMGV